MKKLSKRAEELLKEILEHRNEIGDSDSRYWQERFEHLSVSEEAILCSLFKELKEAEMIATSWANNYPYRILLLGNGISYFDSENVFEESMRANTNTVNIYSKVSGVQIQQGTNNSTQSQSIAPAIEDTKILDFINNIRKYDSLLNEEFGKENAEKMRKVVDELEELTNKPNTEGKKRSLISFIRDLSVNAGGGLLAAGISAMISTLLG